MILPDLDPMKSKAKEVPDNENPELFYKKYLMREIIHLRDEVNKLKNDQKDLDQKIVEKECELRSEINFFRIKYLDLKKKRKKDYLIGALVFVWFATIIYGIF